ncbi:MAG: lytic murein transglycosylase [Gammaproteobacteria bacterium]|nr:lytic murein transglycosylase [Gammaproteobacteria bacterium]MDH5729626.1 lytic murein transglycosylase [Gammaproteobacteria bacterium]
MINALMLYRVLSFTLLLSVLTIHPVFAKANNNDVSDLIQNEITFTVWLEQFQIEARNSGISDNTVQTALNKAKLMRRVIELDRSQPEVKLTFDQYLSKVITQSRIQRGRNRLAKNRKLLDEIYRTFGVPPRFVVALWGIETDYGRLTGGFKVVDALVTLAYEGRRADYFRRELLNALRIIDQGHISTKKMKGSWAGAMGQTQFMPSTFLQYAVDFSGDGKKDVWRSKHDALASGANYLSKIGWQKNQTWGREVKLPDNFDENLLGLERAKSLTHWKTLGVKKINGGDLPDADMRGSIIRLTGEKERSFLVYDNFHVIMQWNRSQNFATAVGILADSIGEL